MPTRLFVSPIVASEEIRRLLADNARIPDECHLALGSYMSDWSHLEQATGQLAAVVFGTEDFLGELLADRMQPNQLRELLTLAASNYMTKSDYDALTELNARWKTASGVRNRIVHGQWRVHLYSKTPEKVEYYRFSHIWDHETATREADIKFPNSRSIREKNAFNAERIRRESALVIDLSNDFIRFLSKCVLRRRSDVLEGDAKTRAPLPESGTSPPSPSTTTLNTQHIRGW